MINFIKEFGQFVFHRKKYWLIPMAIIVFLIGGLIIFSQGSAVAPFIYTLF
ncbi:MAG: DUF5989 family protein [Thermodesulfobacteriota bacterium]|nr:DUF5989 family protein [Thermodesulfobacteriota bacterium]